MSEKHKPTYILVKISSLDEVIHLSLCRVEDVLKIDLDIPSNEISKPLETFTAIFDNYGRSLGYRRHLIIAGIPISTLSKRVYYSIFLLLKDINMSYDESIPSHQ